MLLVLAMALAMCPMALAAGTTRTTNFFTDNNADLRAATIGDKTFDQLLQEILKQLPSQEEYDSFGDEYSDFDYSGYYDAYYADWYNQYADLVYGVNGDYSDGLYSYFGSYDSNWNWTDSFDPADQKTVEALFNELLEAYNECAGYSQSLYIAYYQGKARWYDNAALYDNYCYMWYLVDEVAGYLATYTGEGFDNSFLKKLMPDYSWEYYSHYYDNASGDGDYDSTAYNAASKSESALITEYQNKYYNVYTYTDENGVKWDSNSVEEALANGDIDQDTYSKLARAVTKVQNQDLGAIYVKMLPYRQKMAEAYGYDNYLDYRYDYNYGYDYTVEEIHQYEEAVKTYLVPLYQALVAAEGNIDQSSSVYTRDYSGDYTLDLIAPYVADMSSELLESFNYMREHKMYDFSEYDSKYLTTNETVALYGWGSSYILSDPGLYGSDLDGFFSTVVHEFGHYNSNYYNECMHFFDYFKTTDICETQSQGFELLLTHYYNDIFGAEGANIKLTKLTDFVGTITWFAMMNEFEEYAFTTSDVTLDMLNQEYCRLYKEYGYALPGDERTEMYGWVTTSHLYNTPGYLISYSVSLAGAFNFWLDAQTDFYTGVDEYLKFCALPSNLTFQESFAEIGMENPLSPQYIQELSGKLAKALNVTVASKPIVGSFTDLTAGAWYIDAVSYVYENGLMNGTTATSFDPNGTLNRAMLAQILYNLAGKPEVTESGLFTDVKDSAWYADPINWAASEGIVTGYEDGTFQPTKSITRQELAVMLWRYEGSPESEGNLDSFKDANNVLAYAKDALVWAVANGVVNGYDNGTLQPKANSTRAVVAQMLMNLLADAAEAEE